jgi:hypothetical protein
MILAQLQYKSLLSNAKLNLLIKKGKLGNNNPFFK